MEEASPRPRRKGAKKKVVKHRLKPPASTKVKEPKDKSGSKLKLKPSTSLTIHEQATSSTKYAQNAKAVLENNKKTANAIANNHPLATIPILRTGLKPVYDSRPVRNVYFYKAGDKHFTGLRLPISTRKYRTLDALLDELSFRVPGLYYGARGIYTSHGRHRVQSLDHLEHLGSYVCTDRMTSGRVPPISPDVDPHTLVDFHRRKDEKYAALSDRTISDMAQSIGNTGSTSSDRQVPKIVKPTKKKKGKTKSKSKTKKSKVRGPRTPATPHVVGSSTEDLSSSITKSAISDAIASSANLAREPLRERYLQSDDEDPSNDESYTENDNSPRPPSPQPPIASESDIHPSRQSGRTTRSPKKASRTLVYEDHGDYENEIIQHNTEDGEDVAISSSVLDLKHRDQTDQSQSPEFQAEQRLYKEEEDSHTVEEENKVTDYYYYANDEGVEDYIEQDKEGYDETTADDEPDSMPPPDPELDATASEDVEDEDLAPLDDRRLAHIQRRRYQSKETHKEVEDDIISQRSGESGSIRTRVSRISLKERSGNNGRYSQTNDEKTNGKLEDDSGRSTGSTPKKLQSPAKGNNYQRPRPHTALDSRGRSANILLHRPSNSFVSRDTLYKPLVVHVSGRNTSLSTSYNYSSRSDSIPSESGSASMTDGGTLEDGALTTKPSSRMSAMMDRRQSQQHQQSEQQEEEASAKEEEPQMNKYMANKSYKNNWGARSGWKEPVIYAQTSTDHSGIDTHVVEVDIHLVLEVELEQEDYEEVMKKLREQEVADSGIDANGSPQTVEAYTVV